MKKLYTLFLILFISYSTTEAQTTVVLNPAKDNTLYEDAGGALSNGSGPFLFAGRSNQTVGSSVKRGLMQFDLSIIPAGAIITSVSLELFCNRSSSTASIPTTLHRVTNDWGEGSSIAAGQGGSGAASTTNDATWIHSFFNTSTWTTAGGDYNSTASATTNVTGTGNFTWTSAGLLADVQAWQTTPSSNFGWILLGDEVNGGTARRFSSREATLASERPELTVTYVMPAVANLVISEISYNPPESGSDSTEYIEIYNAGSTTVNLDGFAFTSGVVHTFNSNDSITAGQYFVIGVDSVAMLSRFGIVTREWTSGGLSNGGEPIALKDNLGRLVDSLRYDDVPPWPAGSSAGEPDGGGASIILCNLMSDNTIGSNWDVSRNAISGQIINGRQVFGSPGASEACVLPVVAAAIVDSNVTCNTFSDGGATASATGGAMPYTYSWNNLATTASITGVMAGTYYVTVTDNNGTTDSASVTITEPAALTAAAVVDSNSTGAGMADGGATASATGGTMPYTYSWSNTATTASITGVVAGTYTVTITDANNCSDNTFVIITQPGTLLPNITSVDPSCNGFNDGTASTSPSGGTPPYTYSWSNTSTSSSIGGLGAGTYTLTLTDNNGITAVDSAILNDPVAILASITVDSSPSCPGFTDGGLTASQTGGNAPYTYLWSIGSTTTSITNLGAGTYTVTVTDNIGCTDSTLTTLSDNDITPPTAFAQDITIYLDGAGQASITAADIDNGSSDNCSTPTLAASQTLFNCADLSSAPVIAESLIITGAYDGPLTGGTPKGVELYVLNNISDLSAYGIGSANNGGGTDGEEFTFPAVSATAGQYIYVASEATQFTAFFGFAPDYTDNAMGINGDDAIELFHNGNVIDVFGDINVDGSGQPWEYLDGWAYRMSGTTPDSSNFTLGNWAFSGINVFDGQSTNATSPTPFPLGNYTAASGPNQVLLIATDANSNADTAISNVTVVDTITPVITTCPTSLSDLFADATNQAAVQDVTSLVSATDNCSFAITQSPAAGDSIGLGNTTIHIIVSDGSNSDTCSVTQTVISSVSAAIVVDSNASCNGFSDGGLTAVASNGTMPYTYSWSNSATTASITGVSAGVYTVTITDANGTTDSASSVVTEPAALVASVVVDSNASGAGIADGGATASATGGTTPYTYLWSDPGNTLTASATGLLAGTYTVTITDANACTATAQVTITQPGTLLANITTVDASCSGAANGSATSTPSGGVGPYTFNWSNAQTTSTINGLVAGTYYLTLSDNNGNSVLDSAVIGEPSGIMVSFAVTDASCFNVNDGAITATPSNGNAPYTFNWDDASTSASRSNLSVGSYRLTVTDANGCSSVDTAIVAVNDTVSPTAMAQNITVYLDANGLAAIDSNAVDNGSMDDCAIETIQTDITSFSCADLGSTTVVMTVTDSAGNNDTALAVVTVLDTIAPSIVTQNISRYLDVTSRRVNIVAADVDNGTSDNCLLDSIWISKSVFNCGDALLDTITFYARDVSGNLDSSLAIVNVLDTLRRDSIVTLDTACGSYTWMQNNQTYSLSGIYNDTLRNNFGCDSIYYVLDLEIQSPSSFTDVQVACDSLVWQDGNTYFTNNNTATFILTNSIGCDSIITLDLTITNSTTASQSAIACGSYTWPENNQTYNMTGMYTTTLTNSQNCDSVITLDLEIRPLRLNVINLGDSVFAFEDHPNATYQWYSCDGDSIIPGATGRGFKPDTTGDFSVIVGNGICSDTSACTTVIFIGLDEQSSSVTEIGIYPNPTNQDFFFEVDRVSEEEDMMIFDMNGKMILQQNITQLRTKIQTDGWNAGIYFVRYQDQMKKLVITK